MLLYIKTASVTKYRIRATVVRVLLPNYVRFSIPNGAGTMVCWFCVLSLRSRACSSLNHTTAHMSIAFQLVSLRWALDGDRSLKSLRGLEWKESSKGEWWLGDYGLQRLRESWLELNAKIQCQKGLKACYLWPKCWMTVCSAA